MYNIRMGQDLCKAYNIITNEAGWGLEAIAVGQLAASPESAQRMLRIRAFAMTREHETALRTISDAAYGGSADTLKGIPRSEDFQKIKSPSMKEKSINCLCT